MKLDFNQQLKTCFISSMLALTACSDGTQFVGAFEPEFTATLTGSAVKGVLANADCIVTTVATTPVTLYSSVDAADACTGINGRYSITLSTMDVTDYDDPISVEIKPRLITTYKCDLPAGCDTLSFGQPVPITDSAFSLKAIVPQVTRTAGAITTPVSITPWTSVAAARAEALITTTGSVTAGDIIRANRETAAVLNNILGLEGGSSAFDENFFAIDVADITDPSAGTVSSGDENLGTLLSLASASVLSLVDTTASINSSISQVLSNMTAAFSDGVFDVNATASNIEDLALGIDLTSITGGITEVLDQIGDVVDAADLAAINTNLGGEGALTNILTTTTQIVEQKTAVQDASLDSTKPSEIPDDTLTADQKALDIAIQLDNALKAFVVATDITHGSNTAIEDIDELLRASSDDAVEIIENLAEVAIMAAELLEDEADPVGTLADEVGCNTTATTTTCTTAQAAILLSDESPFVGNTSGTFVITNATNTMIVSDLLLSADGNKYSMTMVGDGLDPETATSANYQITSATVDIGNDGDSDVTVGSTSSFSAAVSDATENPDTATNTLDLDDVMISIPDTFTLNTDIGWTNQLVLDGVELDETLVTAIDFDGSITNNRANDTLTATNGDRVEFKLNIVIDSSTLEGANLPEFEDDGGETSSNFFTVTTGTLRVVAPVTYEKRSTTDYLTTDRDSATETFKIQLDFTRTEAAPVDSYDIELTLASAGGIDRLNGTIANGDVEDTLTLTNGVTGVAANLTATNFTSDTAESEDFGGTVTVDDQTLGAIGASGLYTQPPTNPIFTFQLSVND